ncbi:MAG: hypothetical protein N3A38_11805, partial [Planctomycetota bacterium]|nr:hypothetical protein [Planctomycetota bacterium]
SYIDPVAIQRRIYIYRTIPPLDRCTLSIMKRGNRWTLRELKRTCNMPPAEATRRAVLKWLAESQPADAIPGWMEVVDDERIQDQDEYWVAEDEPLPEPPDDDIPF